MIAFLLFVCAGVVVAQTDCPVAPASPQDRRTNTGRLRIATFNAEWLFPGADPYSPWTIPQAEDHLLKVAAAVAAFNPDMISIQEVQSCTMLQRLIDTMYSRHGITGLKPYMIKGTDTATGQNVGFLTRIDPVANVWRSENRYNYPIAGNTCGYTGGSGNTGVSKHYVANFKISGVNVAMIGQHLLAFPTDPSRCVQREAQESVIRGLVNQQIGNQQEVIIFGDYNDYSDAVKDSANDVPTSRVMKILRNGLVGGTWDYYNETEPMLLYNVSKPEPNMVGTDPNLKEPSGIPPQSQRYTSIYEVNKVSMIDHIVLTSRIYNKITQVVFDHSYAGGTVSDHWPVYIDISTPF
jgi:endonuclease/exonuclease/phosphatase family metal-dependent hydrolase